VDQEDIYCGYYRGLNIFYSEMKINYEAFIQENFSIKNKKGEIVPFVLNVPQKMYMDELKKDYPSLEGIRENIDKARQEGFSSLIDAILTTDFIFSLLGKLPIISGQIISHKKEEVKPLFQRVDLFLNSWLEKNRIQRGDVLAQDNQSSYMKAHNGAELFVGSAGAKTLGRGGTLQNIHWSEVAFYPNTEILNAEDLIIGAEQQVADGVGKIFRESTGNTRADFFAVEYFRGKEGLGEFKSRFFPWYLYSSYKRAIPEGYEFPEEWRNKMAKYKVSPEQIYWYIKKIETAKDKKKVIREYPFEDVESFLTSGECYFDTESLKVYLDRCLEPMKENVIYA